MRASAHHYIARRCRRPCTRRRRPSARSCRSRDRSLHVAVCLPRAAPLPPGRTSCSSTLRHCAGQIPVMRWERWSTCTTFKSHGECRAHGTEREREREHIRSLERGQSVRLEWLCYSFSVAFLVLWEEKIFQIMTKTFLSITIIVSFPFRTFSSLHLCCILLVLTLGDSCVWR